MLSSWAPPAGTGAYQRYSSRFDFIYSDTVCQGSSATASPATSDQPSAKPEVDSNVEIKPDSAPSPDLPNNAKSDPQDQTSKGQEKTPEAKEKDTQGQPPVVVPSQSTAGDRPQNQPDLKSPPQSTTPAKVQPTPKPPKPESAGSSEPKTVPAPVPSEPSAPPITNPPSLDSDNGSAVDLLPKETVVPPPTQPEPVVPPPPADLSLPAPGQLPTPLPDSPVPGDPPNPE